LAGARQEKAPPKLSAWLIDREIDLAFLFAFFVIPEHDSEVGSIVSFGGRADVLKSAAATYFRNFPNKDSNALVGLMNTA
jgi:hypothetical protein